MSVYNALGSAIYSRLTGGTALIAALGGTAIYRTVAPDTAGYPRVVFSHVTGGPDNITTSDNRTQIVQIMSWSDNQSEAGSIDALVSTLLHRYSLSVTGYTVWWCARETEYSLVEIPPNADPIFGVGADYRIRLDLT